MLIFDVLGEFLGAMFVFHLIVEFSVSKSGGNTRNILVFPPRTVNEAGKMGCM